MDALIWRLRSEWMNLVAGLGAEPEQALVVLAALLIPVLIVIGGILVCAVAACETEKRAAAAKDKSE